MNLGASLTRTFVSISLPLAVPGVFASALLVFLYSLDEFTGTLLAGAPFIPAGGEVRLLDLERATDSLPGRVTDPGTPSRVARCRASPSRASPS